MKTYEIYWDDLTPEAKERLKEMYDENFDTIPIAIIDIMEETDIDEDALNTMILKNKSIALDDLPELKKAYTKAVNEAVTEPTTVFTFKGQELLISYAKYVIEYLETIKK